MDLSIFFAKLFGLYFLIAGVIVMYRQRSLMPAVTEIVGSRPLILTVALGQLLAGLALIIAHPIFTADWRGIITLIGAWIVFEALIYLMLPYGKVSKVLRKFNNGTWYTSGGFLAVMLGAYLTGIGFGLWQ